MDLKAVILAGGKGTRLGKLTNTTHKPMIKIKDKPILQYNIELLKKYNITEIFLSVCYLKEKIKDYFKKGNNLGVDINYIEESTPLGTAGPLKLIKDQFTKTFIACNGDELKEVNIEKMYNFHKENNALATIALTEVNAPSNYGVVVLKKNKIVEFIEKPKVPHTNLINAGFYILEPEILDLIPDNFSMLEKEVFPQIVQQGKLCGFKIVGRWFDTGTLERLEEARKKW